MAAGIEWRYMGSGDATREGDEPRDLFTRDWAVSWHSHVPPVALTILILAIWIGLDSRLTSWAVSWNALGRSGALPLIAHMVVHGGWAHVLMNAAALLVLSGPIISRLGAPPISWLRYLYVLVGSGLAGAVLFLMLNRGGTSMLGASGAIFGLVGTLARVHPSTGRAVPIRSARTWVVTKFFVQNHLALFALLAIMAILTGESAYLAWEAHLGGLLFGFFVAPLFLKRAIGEKR